MQGTFNLFQQSENTWKIECSINGQGCEPGYAQSEEEARKVLAAVLLEELDITLGSIK